MEESISTSASTVRTLHQSYADSLGSSKDKIHEEQPEQSQVPSEPQRERPAVFNEGDLPQSQGDTIHDNDAPHTRSAGVNHSPGGWVNAAPGPSTPPQQPIPPQIPTHTHLYTHPYTHVLVLPSPPSSPGPSRSPSIDSVSESSLPSVSSSFFFSSSAPGSPGRSHPGSYPGSYPHSEHEHEHEPDHRHAHQVDLGNATDQARRDGLIIPSLALPSALRRPTPFGQTLGQLRILVLGGQGAGKSFLTGLLMEDNEDVVDVGVWEDWSGGGAGLYGEEDEDGSVEGMCGKVLRASTDWAERRDGFGLERYEPTGNVEIVELPGYAHDADPMELTARLNAVIEQPFRTLHEALHPECSPSAVIANMLAAPTSPLYTAMVVLLPSPPTELDREIIRALSTHIPMIVLPRLHGPSAASASASASAPHPSESTAHASSSFVHASTSASAPTRMRLSDFRPASAVALRSGLFRSPETVALLREEAVERFLRWREVERCVLGVLRGRSEVGHLRTGESIRNGRGVGEEDNEGMREGEGKRIGKGWSKTKWEAEWMEDLSRDVAVRMRELQGREGKEREREQSVRRRRRRTVSAKAGPGTGDESERVPARARARARSRDSYSQHQPQRHPHTHAHSDPQRSTPAGAPPFDPLHLPSLIMLSFSLLSPLKSRVADFLSFGLGGGGGVGDARVLSALCLAGGFCVGLGVGVYVRGW